jgi:hypothetical protein
MSAEIKGNGWARVAFFQAIETLENYTIAGMPILVSGISKSRTMVGEADIQQAYRESIFCPCLRGDEPPQKRFFDALLSGCIPVVLDHPSSELPHRSYFASNAHSNRITYPLAKGSFANDTEMGIDYSELVVAINETCNFNCMMPILEDLIVNHPDIIREKQENIARYASLFSYGMEENGMQFPDAILGMLVQVRHYVNAVY